VAAASAESSLAPMGVLVVEGLPGSAMADVCDVACVDEAKVERAREMAPPRAALATLAEMFRALGDPTRLRILTMLAHEELCVCDLATLTDVSESAVSHSLRTLRQLRLVRYRKAGKIAYYSLDDAHVARLISEGLTHAGEVGRGSAEPVAAR
jgi:ArsR family transcriptional regulator, lead/cadmium/zinc/bismuth-responsive transcriptional repressor